MSRLNTVLLARSRQGLAAGHRSGRGVNLLSWSFCVGGAGCRCPHPSRPASAWQWSRGGNAAKAMLPARRWPQASPVWKRAQPPHTRSDYQKPSHLWPSLLPCHQSVLSGRPSAPGHWPAPSLNTLVQVQVVCHLDWDTASPAGLSVSCSHPLFMEVLFTYRKFSRHKRTFHTLTAQGRCVATTGFPRRGLSTALRMCSPWDSPKRGKLDGIFVVWRPVFALYPEDI